MGLSLENNGHGAPVKEAKKDKGPEWRLAFKKRCETE
jgi:hypothetical protein